MGGSRSSSSSPSLRQFGQLSIFHCNLKEREKKIGGEGKPQASPVSLLDFLNKKLEKRPGKSVQGNPQIDSSFPNSSTAVGIPRVLSGGTSIKSQQLHSDTVSTSAAFRQLKHEGSHISFLLNPKVHLGKSKIESLQPTNIHCSSYAETAPACEEIRSGSQKRKSSSFGDNVQRSSSSHLLVLGDDPKPRKKPNMQRRTKGKPTFFNHYADGGGWWDTDMVGVDSEEVGSTEIWEGMGTTTIGGS